MSIKIYSTPRRDACSTNQLNTLSCYRKMVATLIWQMYYIKFKVYTSAAHKPVTSASNTAIQPQHTISPDIKSIPFSSITPWVTDAETRMQAIISQSWWEWHLISVLMVSYFLYWSCCFFCPWDRDAVDNKIISSGALLTSPSGVRTLLFPMRRRSPVQSWDSKEEDSADAGERLLENSSQLLSQFPPIMNFTVSKHLLRL